MLKKISFLLVLIVMISWGNKVNAKTYYDKINEHGMWISNEFINKEKDGVVKYQQMTLIVRESDGRFVYCIEPGKSIEKDKTFIGYDDNQQMYTNLTNEQWERINLLAYYGYGYQDDNYNHTDIKWYVVTQYMIWQVNNLGYDIYFTDILNGNRISKYKEEMNELELLINEHYKTPNFNQELLETFLGDNYTYFDSNNVLSKYKIISSDINASIYGNRLELVANNVDNGIIRFEKECNNYSNNPIVYVDSESQNLLLPGKIPNVIYENNYYVNYGTLDVFKVDEDTGLSTPQGDASLENALYALFNSNNELLEEKRTDEIGHIRFETKLSAGDYYFKEIDASKGYQLSNKEYFLHIDKNSYNYSYQVAEKIISENYEITKLLNDEKNNVIKEESGIEFAIYNSNDNYISSYVTDNFGKIYFNLPYGNYILKQLSVYDGYEKIKDYQFSIIDNGKSTRLTFIDSLIKYKVNLNVKDKDSNENISNIEFNLFDSDDKKICVNNICSFKTDDYGNILFPGYFKEGEYYVKLIHNEDFDYTYEDEIIKFSVNKNSNYRKVDDYRLIEIYYQLSRNRKEEIIDNTVIEDNTLITVEEQPITIIEQNDTVQTPKIECNKNEVDKEILENESVDKIVDDTIVVDVPNTLKNDYSIYYVIFCIFIIKKLLFKKVINVL